MNETLILRTPTLHFPYSHECCASWRKLLCWSYILFSTNLVWYGVIKSYYKNTPYNIQISFLFEQCILLCFWKSYFKYYITYYIKYEVLITFLTSKTLDIWKLWKILVNTKVWQTFNYRVSVWEIEVKNPSQKTHLGNLICDFPDDCSIGKLCKVC